jgi:NO-binding membrane sensor protein with MHYT domain
MSGAATDRRPRAIFEILLNALGLAIWAAHFGAIYAVNALGCERDWASWRPAADGRRDDPGAA